MTQSFIADFLSDEDNRSAWLTSEPTLADLIDERYDGESDPERYRWASGSHSDACIGEHDEASGACIAESVES